MNSVLSKKKLIAFVLGLFVLAVAGIIIIFMITGKPEMSYADFRSEVETTLYTQSVQFDVEKTSESNGVYTYTLTPSDDGAEFTVESDQDYTESTISGTRYEFEMVYDDYTPYTDYMYVTELGNSVDQEHYNKILGMKYSEEMGITSIDIFQKVINILGCI